MLEAVSQAFVITGLPIVKDSYASHMSDDTLRNDIRQVKEHRTRLGKLQGQHRFEGLFEQWMALVLGGMLNPSPDMRIGAAKLGKALYLAELGVLGVPSVPQCNKPVVCRST